MSDSARYDSRVHEDELAFMRQWTADLLAGDRQTFSYRCGGRKSTDALAAAAFQESAGAWEGSVRSHALQWRDDSTGLTVMMDLIEYADFPAVEWVLRFRNDGDEASPILTEVNALDVIWKGMGPGIPILHRARGSDERPDDFQYLSEPLRDLRTPLGIRMNAGDSATCMRKGHDGRSSIEWLPFFNLQTGRDGLMTAIGWSGRWEAGFANDESGQVRATAGLEYMRLALNPGETVRMPRILLLYWRGEPIHGQNVLRRFILKHHTPLQDGKPLLAPICQGAWGGTPTDGHLDMIETIVRQKLQYDYYWIDAGWYGTSTEPCPDVFHGDWGTVGDWRFNANYHPGGLRPVGDAIHRAGMKFLLWIEPLRATNGTPVTREHPDWFLTITGGPPQEANENLLLNLGNPEALTWAMETVSGLVEDFGIDCYREDFNFFSSLEAFLAHDLPDRQGISEIRFFEGLYAFWDELRSRHPKLMIDNCASGGRRIDLEAISRSIALWRTDYACFIETIAAEAIQVHSCGLAHWVPLSATSPAALPGDTYQFRSALSAGMVFSLNEIGTRAAILDETYPFDWVRRMIAEYRRMRPFWYGDYYPLTTCSTAPDTWAGYQLHRPDLDEGAIVVFRRPESPFTTASFPLRGLTGDSSYIFEDADSGEGRVVTAKSGMHELEVNIPDRRGSRLMFYRRAGF